MREALEVVLGLLELGMWSMLGAVAVQLLRTSVWALQAGTIRPGAAQERPSNPPFLTVQLPLRNERARAEELMHTICALDWPKNRMEVQVLDDSDDDTIAIVDRTAATLRAEGNDVSVIRRDAPEGYKAGALAEGLRTARGEYVAIFDADARPERDCLVRLHAALDRNPRLAYAQARWSFAPERASLLSATQAMILDALFVAEQARLSALGRPVQFNGTGGLFRRSALDAAGGWLGDGARPSVTEDLALSFRLGLAESFGATLPEIAVRTELPDSVAAFRRQQARWVRGAGEVLRVLVRAVARGATPGRARLTMFGHLVRHARQPWLFAFALLWPLSFWVTPRFHAVAAWPSFVGAALLSTGLYFAAVRRRLGRSASLGFLFAPVVMSLSMGLSPLLTRAFLGGASGRSTEFERTPKGGGYAARRGGVLELGLGALYLALAGLALSRGALLEALSLAWFFAFGFLWIGMAAFGR